MKVSIEEGAGGEGGGQAGGGEGGGHSGQKEILPEGELIKCIDPNEGEALKRGREGGGRGGEGGWAGGREGGKGGA